jgi:outer membrane protein
VKTRLYGIEQAKAQEDSAASRLLPQIDFLGNYNFNALRESRLPAQYYSGVRSALRASQALIDLASYFRLQSAQFAVTQNEQQFDAARMSLGGDVVDLYLAVLQAGDEITHLLSEKESIEGQLKRLRFMRERGLVKVTDLFEAEAYYQGLQSKEIEARNARAVALERLRAITGVAAQQVAPLARESFPAVPGREDQWVTDAASNNPNLTALEKAIEVVRSQIKGARADHLPRVTLQANKTYADQSFDNRTNPAYQVGSIGVQVEIPLYSGGRMQAVEREANARFEIARESLEGARREVERDARTAYLTTVSSYARIGSTNAEVQALERTLQAQQKSYELGVTTIVDVLNAQRLLLKSRSDQSKARYDYIRGLTTLRVHAGTLSMRDIEEIDSWMVRQGQGADRPVASVQ